MIKDLAEHFNRTKPDQCIIGIRFLIEKAKDLNPRVYMEVGCGHLGTYRIFEDLLPADGLAIGVDIHPHDEIWDACERELGSKACLIRGDSSDSKTLETIKNALNGRKIDFLFVDGCHHYKDVRADWDIYSPLVRMGGMVVFHDYDPPAVARGVTNGQGPAMVCNELAASGYKIYMVPHTSIGTAYLYKR